MDFEQISYYETDRFMINNFIFQIIDAYFANIIPNTKIYIIQKYMKSYFIFTIVLTVAYHRLLCSHHSA